MTTPIRSCLRAASLAMLALGLSGAAAAQPTADPPSRPIRWVVPFPPAGAMDTIARTLGEQMSRRLGQQVVVENRPGAGGNIGAESVARAAPDGHTMMIVANGMAVNRFLFRRIGYDPVKDFAPVTLLAVVPNVLVANAARNPARSVGEVVAQAKAAPGRVTYASAGNGTSIHLAGELFASMAGIEMTHVPYKGSGPAVTDLIGGQVDYMFDSITSALPHVRSGRLRPIAVTTATRSSALPEVPTVAESGLPGYELSPWFGVFMPAGTPAPVVARMNAELLSAMKLPETRARFAEIGAEPIGSTPEQLAAHLEAEMAKWGRIIRERGIRAD